MRKSNQPGSEFKEIQHDSCDPFSEPTAASEQKYSRESHETRGNRPIRFANDTQRPIGLTALESGISYSFTEMEDNFLHPERRRNHARFTKAMLARVLQTKNFVLLITVALGPTNSINDRATERKQEMPNYTERQALK